MDKIALAMNIRAKMLGVLIRDARFTAKKSIEECAQSIGTKASQFMDYEYGENSPSLPEIEILADYLKVPLEHFWGRETFSKTAQASGFKDCEKLIQIRQRKIGALIRQARLHAEISSDALASKTGLSPATLDAYELGGERVPIPLLEMLAILLHKPLQDFQSKNSQAGVLTAQQQAVDGLPEMPAGLKDFVMKPVNQPYLELAQRLSEMSVEKLRAVAEGLLEITL
jgi:transcriptional regulator with XRE-family HTH domain